MKPDAPSTAVAAAPDGACGGAPATLPVAELRRVLWVRALDAQRPAAWGAADADGATRAAREALGEAAAPARFLAARATHALQRLRQRAPELAAGAEADAAVAGWAGLLLRLSLPGVFALGLMADSLAAGRHIHLLSLPLALVLLWNAGVYLVLLLRRRPVAGAGLLQRSLARGLVRRLGPPGDPPAASAAAGMLHVRFAADWARATAPLWRARAAALLHGGAAALAAGMVAGLYLRGLFLDYRAGWESTFLHAADVHALLATVLAPASALTGIALPDAAGIAALRLAPGQAAHADAAPWIHLMAATLVLAVVLPRGLLAASAAWRAARLARALPLPLHEPDLARLLQRRGAPPRALQLLAHGAAPSEAARATLADALAEALGGPVRVDLAPAVAYGDEDAPPPPAAPDVALRLVLVDLAATPEDDAHGLLLRTLRDDAPALPRLLLADAAGWRARFAALPAREAERRAAWVALAAAQGVGFAALDLSQADGAGRDALRDALQQALHAAPGAGAA